MSAGKLTRHGSSGFTICDQAALLLSFIKHTAANNADWQSLYRRNHSLRHLASHTNSPSLIRLACSLHLTPYSVTDLDATCSQSLINDELLELSFKPYKNMVPLLRTLFSYFSSLNT